MLTINLKSKDMNTSRALSMAKGKWRAEGCNALLTRAFALDGILARRQDAL